VRGRGGEAQAAHPSAVGPRRIGAEATGEDDRPALAGLHARTFCQKRGYRNLEMLLRPSVFLDISSP